MSIKVNEKSQPGVPRVSVIIPVYNGGESFRRCLGNLVAAMPPPYEIIVVADGVTDGSDQLARSFGLEVLNLPQQSGPATARNAGARAASGDVLFFLDADVVAPVDVISSVSAVFQTDSELAALFGSYDDAPGEANFLSQYKNLL